MLQLLCCRTSKIRQDLLQPLSFNELLEQSNGKSTSYTLPKKVSNMRRCTTIERLSDFPKGASMRQVITNLLVGKYARIGTPCPPEIPILIFSCAAYHFLLDCPFSSSLIAERKSAVTLA
eukprot:6179105-Pleurochrysis_carterae.AAC.1